MNLTSPDPVTNAEMTAAMGRVLHRPALLPAPALALRAVLGEFSSEVLTSLRVLPGALTEAGFTWAAPRPRVGPPHAHLTGTTRRGARPADPL